MAIAALSMCTFFNLTAISNLFWITGVKRGTWLGLDNHDGRLYLLGIMMISIFLNIAFSNWRRARRHADGEADARPLPPMTPLIYLIGSFIFFMVTLFVALATVPSA